MPNKVKVVFLTALALTVMGAVSVFAAEPTLDIASLMTGSLNQFLSQMTALVGVIAPIVITIVGAQIGIGYGVRMWRSLTNR